MPAPSTRLPVLVQTSTPDRHEPELWIARPASGADLKATVRRRPAAFVTELRYRVVAVAEWIRPHRLL